MELENVDGNLGGGDDTRGVSAVEDLGAFGPEDVGVSAVEDLGAFGEEDVGVFAVEVLGAFGEDAGVMFQSDRERRLAEFEENSQCTTITMSSMGSVRAFSLKLCRIINLYT